MADPAAPGLEVSIEPSQGSSRAFICVPFSLTDVARLTRWALSIRIHANIARHTETPDRTATMWKGGVPIPSFFNLSNALL